MQLQRKGATAPRDPDPDPERASASLPRAGLAATSRHPAATNGAAGAEPAPAVVAGRYEALLLDLDGTLLDERGEVRPRNREALERLRTAGVPVMIVTGRSALSALPVVEELGLETLSVLFNGGAVWCPRRRRLIEERVLSGRCVARAIEFARESELLTVVMCADRKLALDTRDPVELAALRGLRGLQLVSTHEELHAERVHRVTWISARHQSSVELAALVESYIDLPVYVTHFPLGVLVTHRESALQVVDVHPPSRGKAEALRVLEEHYGIPAERAVAVGDASNDVPMLLAAGLGVCMASGMDEARAAAQRVIGGHDTDAIAELALELFPD